jgi:hypothetical protein
MVGTGGTKMPLMLYASIAVALSGRAAEQRGARRGELATG